MTYTAIDIEAIGLHPYKGTIWILSITKNKKTITLHDCNGKVTYFAAYKKELEDKDVCKIIHNAQYDGSYIQLCTGIQIRNIWDTQIVETVIQGAQIPRGSKNIELIKQHSSALEHTLIRYGFPQPDKTIRENFIDRAKGIAFTKQELNYAGSDTKHLHELQRAQEYILTRDGGLEVALLENKVVEVVIQMKVKGLGVDTVMWNKIADANLKIYNKTLSQLPTGVNWNSPKQVKNFFFDRGILIQSFTELEAVTRATNDPYLNTFYKARQLYSNTTAYGKKWLLDKDGESVVDDDGRIRTDWQQLLSTPRFSTSNPNILALPKEGNQRRAIVPDKGNVLVIGDYTGQEIGVMAAAAKEDMWIDALLRGESVHSLTASLIFSNEWQQGKERNCKFPFKCDCKLHRSPYERAKVINFMLAYGGGPKKFAEKTGCDDRTARKVVYKHKQVIRKLTRYLDNNAKQAVKTGVAFSADPYKRRMVLKGEEEWQIANQGKNYPIQSAGANMLKLAMISIPEEFPIVLPFHDELVLEVPARKAEKAAKVMRNVMNQSADYITGISGIIKVKPRIALNFMKQ